MAFLAGPDRGARGIALALVAGLLPPVGAIPTRAAEARAQVHRPAPGMLLVARPHLSDPNFTRTVVLIVHYDEGGAMGLVINRRAPVPLDSVAPRLSATLGPAAELRYGGPVALDGLHVLVRAASVPEGSFHVFGDVHLCGAPAAVERIAAEGGAQRRVRVFAGYSGWGAGQLDRELERGDWIVRPATADDVFGGGEGLWRDLAPADPSRSAGLRRPRLRPVASPSAG
jgi:putative transcriptional regulator